MAASPPTPCTKRTPPIVSDGCSAEIKNPGQSSVPASPLLGNGVTHTSAVIVSRSVTTSPTSNAAAPKLVPSNPCSDRRPKPASLVRREEYRFGYKGPSCLWCRLESHQDKKTERHRRLGKISSFVELTIAAENWPAAIGALQSPAAQFVWLQHSYPHFRLASSGA